MYLPQIVMPAVSGTTVFCFNDTAPPVIYTLSLHDALPISCPHRRELWRSVRESNSPKPDRQPGTSPVGFRRRSEEHTSELQSRGHLVCRLLLEKKNNITPPTFTGKAQLRLRLVPDTRRPAT